MYNNAHARFIVSGRTSSFVDFDICNESLQMYLEKYIDQNDNELKKLLEEYNGTPIVDLLPIPTYRNSVLENNISKNSKFEDFHNLLVQSKLKEDMIKRNRSGNTTNRMSSRIDLVMITNKLSEFCYMLFANNRYVFSENELKNYIGSNEELLFLINSAIIDFYDEQNISFISNFYFEYFISYALLLKSKKIIFNTFFTEGKVKISCIDLLMIFLSVARTKNEKMYERIERKMLKDNVNCVLLCEFSALSDKKRYEYFKIIFNKCKKENQRIYYGRFRPVFGPLKNINNMAQRMQQLIPDSYKLDCINFIKGEIYEYLSNPSKEDVISFGNAIILLIPFIENIWTKNEQRILKELSIKLIQFFLKNNLSTELEGLLSEKFIIDWYELYKWTVGWKNDEWEKFYYEITGKSTQLLAEIYDEFEFRVKFNIFSIFYSSEEIKPMLFPIMRYVIKNKYSDGYGMAATVPEMISDEYETPLIKTDDRIFLLSHILENIEISFPEILDLLVFAVENDVYQQLKNSYNNPLSILETNLYQNITAIDKNDFKSFSIYYLNCNEYDFDERLFQIKNSDIIDELKIFLVYEIITLGIPKWRICHIIHKLLDISNKEISLEHINKIKECMQDNIYKDIIYYIFHSKEHILNESDFIIKEYNIHFAEKIKKDIEKEKLLNELQIAIQLSNENEITLLLDNDAMIAELYKINDFLQSPKIIDRERTPIGKLFYLHHESLINIVSYNFVEDDIPPIFSESALKIMEDFYRNNKNHIGDIINDLQEFCFKNDNFYIYFYWVYINKRVDKEKDNVVNMILSNQTLYQKIIMSMDKDASIKFNHSLEVFEKYDNSRWLIPFMYYYKNILNRKIPSWLKIEYILKLIVVLEPSKSSGGFMSLSYILCK